MLLRRGSCCHARARCIRYCDSQLDICLYSDRRASDPDFKPDLLDHHWYTYRYANRYPFTNRYADTFLYTLSHGYCDGVCLGYSYTFYNAKPYAFKYLYTFVYANRSIHGQ